MTRNKSIKSNKSHCARDEIANEGEKNERKAKEQSLEKFLTVEWLRTSIKYSTKECPDRFPRKV